MKNMNKIEKLKSHLWIQQRVDEGRKKKIFQFSKYFYHVIYLPKLLTSGIFWCFVKESCKFMELRFVNGHFLANFELGK